MESRFKLLVVVTSVANAVCIAACVVFTLEYDALYDLGFSSEQVCGGAMIAAILVATLMAIDFFCKKLGKAK
jgi:hypothetical protein